MMMRAAAVMRAWPRALRWPLAELIPFGCLFAAMLLTRAGAGLAGFILGLAGIIVTSWYLNWVQDAHVGWILPPILFTLPAIYVGELVFGHATGSGGNPLVITPAYWEAFGGLLAVLAVMVALAVVNGERHRGRYNYLAAR